MLVKYDVNIMHELESVNWIVGDTMQINLPDLVKKEIKCLGSIKCEKEEIERIVLSCNEKNLIWKRKNQ